MDRVAPSPLPFTPAYGGGTSEGPDLCLDPGPMAVAADATPEAPARFSGGSSSPVDRDAELDRTYDLVERMSRDERRSSPPQWTTRAPDGPPPEANDVSESLAGARERARIGAPAARVRNDPTALPSDREEATSRTAVRASGLEIDTLKKVPYFDQGRAPWASYAYPRHPAVHGEMRTIQSAGCAPTALAMIDCGLRDAHTSPIDVAKFAVDRGYSGSRGTAGTDTAHLARAWAKQCGLGLSAATSHDQSKNVDVLKTGLRAGGIAMVSVGVDRATGSGHFTSKGHVIVINGCAMKKGEEWFAVANPGRANQSEVPPGQLALDAHVEKVHGAKNGIGQVWISRTQLEAEMKYGFVFRPGAES